MKDRISKFLKAENIPASKFADEIGVQRSSISHILAGRNNPSLELIQKILNRFDHLNPDWLILGKGEMYRGLRTPSLFDQSIMEPKIEDKTSSEPVVNNVNDIHLPVNENKSIEQEVDKILTQNSSKKIVEKLLIIYTDGTFGSYSPAV
jgi:transcriptional regulator with XRE-family HTH domain